MLHERRLRDNQRAKVYRAEGAALGAIGCQGWGRLSYAEMSHVVSLIQETDWWQNSTVTPPNMGQGKAAKNNDLIYRATREWDVTITDGRGRRTACAIPLMWEIRMPTNYRRLEVIVHELAHLIDPVWDGEPHGPAWVHTYLMGLCAIGLQDRAYRLATAMIEGKVRGAREPAYYLEQETQIDLTHYDAEDSQARDRGEEDTHGLELLNEAVRSAIEELPALARVKIG